MLNGKYPFEMVHGFLPDYSLFKAFGCLCFATNQNVRDKFGARAAKCIFLGYAELKKTYKMYDLETGNLFYSRDVQFLKNLFPFKFGNTSSETMSKDVLKFVKTFPFCDEPKFSVNDEQPTTSEGNDLATPSDSTTDLVCPDATPDEASNHGQH